MTAQPFPERESAAEWVRTALLCANLAWTTLCLGGSMPPTQAVTAALTAALLAAHLADGSRPPIHGAVLALVPFLAYGACNAAWVSPVGWLGWRDWYNWAQAAAVFWVVLDGIRSDACRRTLCASIGAVAVASCAMALYQHFVDPKWLMLGRTQVGQYLGRSAGSFGYPNFLGALTALLIPPAAWAAFGPTGDRKAALAARLALAALLAGFVLAISRGAWVALGAALVLAPLLASDLGAGRRVLRAAAALAAAAAVLLVVYAVYPSMRERLNQMVADLGEKSRPVIWLSAWRIFTAHPFLGSGAGSFGIVFESQRPEGFIADPQYAHCEYLNTLSDYGIVGFVLLLAPALVIGWKGRRARGMAGAAWVGLLAFSLHMLVDFHLKAPGLAMVFAAVAALVTSQVYGGAGRLGGKARVRHRAAGYAAGALVAASAALFVPRFRAEACRWSARVAIDRMGEQGAKAVLTPKALGEVRASLARAVALDPGNAQAWSDKAYADSLWAFVEPKEARSLGREAEQDSARAIALSPVVSEFWIRKGTGLDMQGRWVEAGGCFVRALVLAPSRPDSWYYQAFHLSLDRNDSGPAIAATDYCLRLDPGFLLAQVLRERLERRSR